MTALIKQRMLAKPTNASASPFKDCFQCDLARWTAQSAFNPPDPCLHRSTSVLEPKLETTTLQQNTNAAPKVRHCLTLFVHCFALFRINWHLSVNQWP